MMVLRKKTVVIITLVLLVIAAGYVSTKYGRVIKVDKEGKSKTEGIAKESALVSDNVQVAAGYFIDIKLQRESERDSSKQTLKGIIDDANSSKEAKTKAENKLLELVNNSETEMVSEALIKSQGFEDALVFINNSQVNVTVKAKEITAEQIDKIKNIVCRQSGIPATNIMVQSRE